MSDDPARTALNAIVDALQPLESSDRKRAVLGALHFLDEDWVPLPQMMRAEKVDVSTGSEADSAFSPSVQVWMKKSGLSPDEVEQVFDFSDGKINIIADLPGVGKRERTMSIYQLMGVGTFLFTGGRKFSDEIAREACQDHNAYDSANHSKTMKELKNDLTGDKGAGWSITTPGLTRGAGLVKQLAARSAG